MTRARTARKAAAEKGTHTHTLSARDALIRCRKTAKSNTDRSTVPTNHRRAAPGLQAAPVLLLRDLLGLLDVDWLRSDTKPRQ